MTTIFIPQGTTISIAYADDSTDASVTIQPGSQGVPNALYVVNPDAANVVAVNYGTAALDTNAVVPTALNGLGVVIAANSAVLLRVDSTYQTGNLYVSAAGISGTGQVYVTPGAI